MSTAAAFGIGFVIITFGGLGMAGFLLWLRNRDAQQQQADSDPPTEACPPRRRGGPPHTWAATA